MVSLQIPKLTLLVHVLSGRNLIHTLSVTFALCIQTYLAVHGREVGSIRVNVNAVYCHIRLWYLGDNHNIITHSRHTILYDIICLMYDIILYITMRYESFLVYRYIHPHQLLIVVCGEFPHMDGTTLVPDDEGGLVRVETHAIHRSIHLEEPLALLTTPPEREGGDGWVR